MDKPHTYGTRDGLRIMLYALPGIIPPAEIVVTYTEGGHETVFTRLADSTLVCHSVAGVKGACESFECHRAELGKCQCGRHEGRVAFAPERKS